jgi:hypothetical protein
MVVDVAEDNKHRLHVALQATSDYYVQHNNSYLLIAINVRFIVSLVPDQQNAS